ncbi:Uncharacterized protein Rs2_17465 [Raphanus sativus]|nr:Uncharacterized protein Rs2_17465 [Raphanus sativus]
MEKPEAQAYYRKPIKPIRYMLREQRLVFVLVGIAIATVCFTLFSPSSTQPIPIYNSDPLERLETSSGSNEGQFLGKSCLPMTARASLSWLWIRGEEESMRETIGEKSEGATASGGGS